MDECDECNGVGTKLIRQFKLYETCKKCHGYGEMSWLDKVFGKRSKYYDACARNNIEILLQCITEYCEKKVMKLKLK